MALAAGLAGARFPKALAWPLAALLSLLGATGLLHALRPAEEGVPESPSPEKEESSDPDADLDPPRRA